MLKRAEAQGALAYFGIFVQRRIKMDGRTCLHCEALFEDSQQVELDWRIARVAGQGEVTSVVELLAERSLVHIIHTARRSFAVDKVGEQLVVVEDRVEERAHVVPISAERSSALTGLNLDAHVRFALCPLSPLPTAQYRLSDILGDIRMAMCLV